ncbi:hypothetical protein K2X33_06395, partial [bacterium]|nr:hypothetical protein [bacterium]
MRIALLLLVSQLGFAAETTPNTPPQWSSPQFSLGDAWRTTVFEARLPEGAVQDPEGKPLTLRFVGKGPTWLKVDSQGVFKGIPSKKDSGSQTWTVEASDGKLKSTAIIEVKVGNRPPAFADSKAALPEGLEEKKFEAAFPIATDPDGDTLQYTLKDAPPWLKLVGKKLTGSPVLGSAPQATATLEASDGSATATLALVLPIREKNQPPKFLLATPLALKERE